MKAHYDFSTAERNPYTKRLTRQVTIQLDLDTVAYFKDLATDAGVPYRTLINLYLWDCVARRR